MTTKFNIGDRVRVIVNSGQLKQGEAYTINEIHILYHDGYGIQCKIVNGSRRHLVPEEWLELLTD